MVSTILCLDSFTKECSSNSIFFVILNQMRNFLHFGWRDGSNGLYNEFLALSLSEICRSLSSLCPSNVL